MSHLLEFKKVIAALRDPKSGCPWDLAQTHVSLKKYFLEEVYEFLDEVEKGDAQKMEEELGDCLLQIYLHARLLEESTHGERGIESVAQRICEKMIHRHPHVFDPDWNDNGLGVEANWSLRKGEKNNDIFAEYSSWPLLAKIEKIFSSVKKKGFRFASSHKALEKVQEELDEVRAAKNREELREELGDLVLSSCSAIIELGFSPEEVLHHAFFKFSKRFKVMEANLEKNGLSFSSLDEDGKKQEWSNAKKEVSDGRSY